MAKPVDSTLLRNVVIVACAVDAADKALLPATFKALSEEMKVGPKELGALTFAQSIAFSLALPVWGSMLSHFPVRDLLVFGCCLWSASTLLIATTTTFAQQFCLRLLNGAALAAVNPLGQAVICDVVPEQERGRAFGLLASASSALMMIVGAGATATAASKVGGFTGWRLAHVGMALTSAIVALLLHRTIPKVLSAPGKPKASSWFSEQRLVVRTILGKPSFVILVLQGVTGGVPWNGLAFLTLFFQLSGYSDGQAGQIVLWGGVGGALGGYVGGALGDHFGAEFPDSGRVATAQASVLLGTLCFIWLVHVPSGYFLLSCVVYFSFSLTASWTPAAACRPICGALFRDSRERAQVLALWIALEGVVASVFGAPLAGALSESFGFRLDKGVGSVGALRSALLGVAIIPWILCFLAWIPMYWAFPRDRVPEELDPVDHQELSEMTRTSRDHAPVKIGAE